MSIGVGVGISAVATRSKGGGAWWNRILALDSASALVEYYSPALADKVTLTSGAVSGLTDLSGGGNNGSQSTSTRRPTISAGAINGRDALNMAANAGAEASNSSIVGTIQAGLASGYTVIQVHKFPTTVANMGAFSIGRAMLTADGAQVLFFRTATGVCEVILTPNTARPQFVFNDYQQEGMASVLSIRASLTRQELRLNGRLIDAETETPVAYDVSHAWGFGTQGGLGVATAPGYYGDYLLYAGYLSDAQIAAVETVLCEAYGIAHLPTKLATMRNAAHKGDQTVAPENTIAAFSTAGIADPAKFNGWIETDIRKSSDGVWVLMHDASVDRTTDGTGNVSSKTLSQLKALDAGSWFDVAFTGERIPTLQEALDYGVAHGLKFIIEPKIGGVSAQDVTDILAMVDATVGRSRFVWSSFVANDLVLMRAAAPTVELSLLSNTFDPGEVTTVAGYGSNASYSLPTTQWNYENQKACNDAGVKLEIWADTINSTVKVRQANQGVNSFITGEYVAT